MHLRHFFENVSLEGDGAIVDAVGDYSVTPTRFIVKPPPGEIVVISHIMVMVADVNIQGLTKYGGLDELTNGINLYIWKGDDIIVEMNSFSDQVPGRLDASGRLPQLLSRYRYAERLFVGHQLCRHRSRVGSISPA